MYLFPTAITTMAVHPVDGCVALGDAKGRIRMVYVMTGGVDGKAGAGGRQGGMAGTGGTGQRERERERPVQEGLHWHARAVAGV
ncbi:hypothetical protein HDU93_000491, partial [Gonapodya sp. JEL0774]